MLTRRVIPCLDVADGRVVKGTRFVDLRDEGDPPELAERYANEGADEIVYLDIGAAPQGRGTLLDIVERTARRAFIPLTVGGGVRSVDDMREVLRAGADKVGLNTRAVAEPDLVTRCAARFGSQAVVVAIDARRVARGDPALPSGYEVVVNGGREPVGLDAVAWAVRAVELGAGELLVTSIDRDGTGHGFDTDLLRAISSLVPVPVIASGGAARARRLRGGHPGRGCRRRPCGGDLPPARGIDRRRQGGDGSRGPPRPRVRPGGGRMTPITNGDVAAPGPAGPADASCCLRTRGAAPGPVDLVAGPDPAAIAWDQAGLVAGVVQDVADGRVLMVAWLDAEALAATLRTGDVHFHSRSRDRLWRKGESSGNVLRLRTLAIDCDGDALLLGVEPAGPTCHRGTRSCFDADGSAATATIAATAATQGFAWLESLWATISERAAARTAGSYTVKLLDGGVDLAGRKVAEEATEVLLAAKNDEAAEAAGTDRGETRGLLAGEAGDLLYHALVLLAERGLEPRAVLEVLRGRQGRPHRG